MLPECSKLTKAFVAAENGWTHEDFHNIVDGNGPTLTIIKNTVGYVFGGYTDIAWQNDGGDQHGDGNSWQFFFKDGKAVKIPSKGPGLTEITFRYDLLTSF